MITVNFRHIRYCGQADSTGVGLGGVWRWQRKVRVGHELNRTA